MAAMLAGSGGAAQAGWATRPSETTASANTTMRTTRFIASPYGSRASQAYRRCRPSPQWSTDRSAGLDVAEHDPHHVIGRMDAVVLAVQPHGLTALDHGERVTGAGRHLQHAVHVHRIQGGL